MEIKKQTTTQQNVCVLPLKIQLSTGEGRNPINRYNSTTCLWCLSQIRIWISDVIYRGFPTLYLVDFQRHISWISNVTFRGFPTSYVVDFQRYISWIFNVICRGFPTLYVLDFQRHMSWISNFTFRRFQRHKSWIFNVICLGLFCVHWVLLRWEVIARFAEIGSLSTFVTLRVNQGNGQSQLNVVYEMQETDTGDDNANRSEIVCQRENS